MNKPALQWFVVREFTKVKICEIKMKMKIMTNLNMNQPALQWSNMIYLKDLKGNKPTRGVSRLPTVFLAKKLSK